MRLEEAKPIAHWLVQHLAPVCDRIDVAGSIRRECAEVKDIEILAIPKFDFQNKKVVSQDLFATVTVQMVKINLLYEALLQVPGIRWIKPGTSLIEDWPLKPDGKYFRGYIESKDIKVDIFTACQDNWGLQHAIRTGPEIYSHKVFAVKWCRLGYKSSEGVLRKNANGAEVVLREEADLFNLLKIPFVEPRFRN